MLKLITFIAFSVLLLAAMAGPLSKECRSAEEDEEGLPRTNPHDFSNPDQCAACHTDTPPLLSKDPMTTCIRCHPGNIRNHPVTRHPMGFTARIRIPAALPLTEDGELVCYTCHEPHGKAAHSFLLRIEYLKLCASCHRGY